MTDRYRRTIGGLYGLLLGLVYALIAGTIDWLTLRDVPLRVDGPVVASSVVLTGLLGLGLGVLTAWPESFAKGVIYGALGISIGGALRSLALVGVSFETSFALSFTLLSRAALSAPIALAMRAMTYWHEDSQALRPGEITPRHWLPLGAILLGMLFGSLSQMSSEAQAAVRQTHRMIENALQAQTLGEIPPALWRVSDFQAKAGSTYQLDQRLSPLSVERLIEVRVFFDNGFVVSCVHIAEGSQECEEVQGD